jgi:hypothetical protein
MHIGGALANVVVRGDDPSAAGQGVSPVIDAPRAGTVSGTDVVAPELELELEPELELVATGFLSLPLRSEITTMAATITTTIRTKFRTVRHRCRRFCSTMAAATRAWRPSRWRSLLAEGMNAKS